jgi:ABC-type nitrate/sulfonate/bicarbonate transport system permease component
MKVLRAFLRAWPPVVLALALLTIWQLYVQLGDVDPLILPAPLRILSATIAHTAVFQAHIGTTINEAIVGLLVALACGVLTAASIDVSPVLRRALYPLLVASQAIPIIAIAPLMIFWFGYGLLPKVVVVTLICFFPITVSMADGLRSTDPELIKLYRTFGAGEFTIFWRVRLPNALPSFFSGLKIAATYSVIGAIFGEYVGAIYGLGVLLQTELRSFRTDLLFGVVFITVLLSVALFALISLIERVALPWYFAGGRERDWREAGQRPRRSYWRGQAARATEQAPHQREPTPAESSSELHKEAIS